MRRWAGDICARAEAFGIETARGNTWDWQALAETTGDLIAAMRADGRPRFLQIETYRLKAHSKGDDTRERHVVEPFEIKDPINRLLSSPSAEVRAWLDDIQDRVRRAEQVADQAPHASIPTPKDRGAAPAGWTPAPAPKQQRMVAALNETFDALMREFGDIIMLGEDVLSPYGGAFKATSGLSDSFPGRVLNTPISEACIVGVGAGLGLVGVRPLVEIMFGDFIGLAFDQIVNHAAKFHQMYNEQVTCNLIVRTPMGGGRGYGPTHSQTFDKHFLGVPGLRVVAINGLIEPSMVYRPLVQTERGPTLVIENKLLYGSYLPLQTPVGFELLHSDETFPSAWLRGQAAECDLTLLGYGGTADMLIQAADRLFEEHDLVAQVLVVTQIYPFDITRFAEVLAQAPNLLIVEEGQGFAGFGAEVVGQLAESDLLGVLRVRRLSPPAYCIPSSGPLEKDVLPSIERVVALATDLAAG